MHLRFSLLGLILIGAFATAAGAGPINITESTDFPNSGVLTPFILDVGANTIAGTESAVGSGFGRFRVHHTSRTAGNERLGFYFRCTRK